MPNSVRADTRVVLMRNVRSGVQALWAHRLRSLLSMLGVVFGAGAVVCMLAIGKGAERRVMLEIGRLGVHNLHVESQPRTSGGSAGLRAEDALFLSESFSPHVEGTAPLRVVERSVWIGGVGTPVQVLGVTPAYARYLDLVVDTGRFISDLDQKHGTSVCVLSLPFAQAHWPAQDPVGRVVRLGDHALRVVGVVRGVAVGTPASPALYIPLRLAWRILPHERDPRQVERIVVHMRPDADPSSMARMVRTSIHRRHGSTQDFQVVVPSELIRKEQRTQRIFRYVMGGIAGVGLLVGGIGIANIMFANVLERTTEIGIRRAVGARRSDILSQFMFEAAVIGGAGGLGGIVLGALGAIAVARAADWPIWITPGSILLAAGTALGTGLVAGGVPARQATRVQAAQALHHE